MFEKIVTSGDYIIRQGDDGDNFYVIERYADPYAAIKIQNCYETKVTILTHLCNLITVAFIMHSCQMGHQSLRKFTLMKTLAALENWLCCTTCLELPLSRQLVQEHCGPWIARLSVALCSRVHSANGRCMRSSLTVCQCSSHFRYYLFHFQFHIILCPIMIQ